MDEQTYPYGLSWQTEVGGVTRLAEQGFRSRSAYQHSLQNIPSHPWFRGWVGGWDKSGRYTSSQIERINAG